jgi:hypothetical protein
LELAPRPPGRRDARTDDSVPAMGTRRVIG